MKQLGHYEILRRLATGGMAEIYLARARGTAGFEKLVVLKRLLPDLAQHKQIQQMFLDEARLAATLHHHNIGHVFDVGEDDGAYFFAMEYIYGQDARRIRQRAQHIRKPIPFEIALAIGIGASSALDYAHGRTAPDGSPMHVVHRDVSPSNILVSYDGAVKLLDFGIARMASRSANTTTDGNGPKGKVPYMSPEQCLGEELDRRSDLFSLGTVLYELTTGERPFSGYSDYEVMEMIVEGTPAPPSELRGEYPAGLDAVILRLLRRDRELRYQDAHSVLEDLERVVALNGAMCSALVVQKYMRSLFADMMTGANPIVRPTTLDEALGPLLSELDADSTPEAIPLDDETEKYEKADLPEELYAAMAPPPRAESLSPEIEVMHGVPDEDLAIPLSGATPLTPPPEIVKEPPPPPPAPPVKIGDLEVRFNPVGTAANDERVSSLLDRAVDLHAKGEVEQAIAAVELAFKVDPDRPLGRHHGAVLKLYETFLGDRNRKPRLSRALSTMGDGEAGPIHQKGAFLLSRIDGTLSLDEVLDISGMPRVEAYRHLAQLFVVGALRW